MLKFYLGNREKSVPGIQYCDSTSKSVKLQEPGEFLEVPIHSRSARTVRSGCVCFALIHRVPTVRHPAITVSSGRTTRHTALLAQT